MAAVAQGIPKFLDDGDIEMTLILQELSIQEWNMIIGILLTIKTDVPIDLLAMAVSVEKRF